MPETAPAANDLLSAAFRDPGLREEALRHRSAGNPHYERLEYLGDAVLNFVIAEALYTRLPDATEGELTRLRSQLVRGETLAELARQLALGEALELGPGELKAGSHRRRSILADVLEALIGARLCDAGFETVRGQILSLYADRLNNLPDANSLKDAKTRLQEWLQADGRALPAYSVIAEEGPAHSRTFTVRCQVDAEPAVTADGRSRRAAEQAAARRMLAQLQS